MEPTTFVIDSRILDWLAVGGYLSFLLLVIWGVINSKKKSD